MFEGAVAGILNRLLGRYVQDLDTENLNVGIFSGDVNLTDLKLKPEALYELDLPIDVKIGTIGRINIQIPWQGLCTQPVTVQIQDVLVLVGPAISNSYFDPEREKRLMRAAKRKILQDLEAENEILKGPQNFFEQLFTAIVNNLQIYVRNVHVRYEDSISSKDGPLACGLCLQSMSIETTNSKWKPSVTPVNASTVYQMMRIESVSLYWNPTATVLDDAETARITPMQYYNWKHYMLTGLDKFSMHHEDFEFLLKPVSCKVKVLINRSGEARVPRLLLDAVIQDSAVQLSRRQYLSIDNLLNTFSRVKLNRKYRHLHPGTPLTKDVKKWWLYAFNAVLEQRVRPYTWASIRKHRENYNSYKQTYKSTLRSPNDTELKLDLQKCEDGLPILSVVIAREQAKFELLTQEPDRIEMIERESAWWRTGSESDSDGEGRAELCVKTERSRSLWAHLSSPEKKKLAELIGYVEGSSRQDKSKQFIEHKLNLTLVNFSLSLLNRNKEVLVVTLTQFLTSLETRPLAKAYKISARAESVVVEGLSSDGELIPLVTSERASPTTTNLLALDVEKNPNSEADYGLCLALETLEMLYVEHAFTELINFFQTHSMTSEELSDECSQMMVTTIGRMKATVACAVSRRRLFQINVDVKGPRVVVPEYGSLIKSGRVIVFDVYRITVKSDLQPSNLELEDATCMELEERLYDRLHADCSFQVLFCEWGENWRESRLQADSELHLVPKTRIQVVFSNSIKKDYKLLPRYKLNISLSSFKLNLSDRIIVSLLDFYDNLPVPVPNTVPVSFLDSGDYIEGIEDAELMESMRLDAFKADPGYKELVKLRQKIVAAYLSRNRTPDSAFDKSSAKLGFQSSEQVFMSSEHSDEDMEIYARSVDLPGFDDNVSPSNTIHTLLRFVIGEIVINLSRSMDQTDRPYIMLSISKVCLDVALMVFGPAVQLSIDQVLLTDKQHHQSSGQYLELITSEENLIDLIYRKVRANCPEFRSHFHSVEQALVGQLGTLSLSLHAPALLTLNNYLHYIYQQMQSRHSLDVKAILMAKSKQLWNYFLKPELDPPVPTGATKFSYSARASSVTLKLMVVDFPLVEVRLQCLESDCVFRANDRCIFKLYLAELHLDHLSETTLYTKLIWPDEDKVLELKYVRAAPRFYGSEQQLKAHGQLKLYVGRLHVVFFCSVLHHLQQFLEPLIQWNVLVYSSTLLMQHLRKQLEGLRACSTRICLAVEVHAPVLLLPQKPSSPNLLVLNIGDLHIENFFKQLNFGQEVSSPIQPPVIENMLMKLNNVTLCRAVMTLAGTLEIQEPILESLCLSCDMKRTLSYQQVVNIPRYREVLLFEANMHMNDVSLNMGQRDLATLLAVWTDNLCETRYIGSVSPSSPVDTQPIDSAMTKLQAFFAQGEPVRKEATLRFTLEGVELKLFSDMDEVLSSPVRDVNHALAKLTAGEISLHIDWFSDAGLELRASLQSLLLEDIRPDPTITIKRIFQSQGGSSCASDGISVHRPPLVDIVLTSRVASSCDVRVDRTRLNLALPFLMQLMNCLLNTMPGDKTLEGGVVNHGYVGDLPTSKSSNNNRRFPSSSDSTSGYYSTVPLTSEETSGLSVSIQFRQPEVMFFTDLTKTESHALLLRTELLVDYSYHSNSENLVVSLAGLQIISKVRSKLKNLPAQLVLKPCDIEFSRCFKNFEDGVKVNMSISDIDLHIAATTVHTVLDIIEEISSELPLPEDKEPFIFTNFNLKSEKDEDIWSPRKISPYVLMNTDDSYEPQRYSGLQPAEIATFSAPSVRVFFEIEHTRRQPVIIVKLSSFLTLQDWSRQLTGSASLSVEGSCFNEMFHTWEPLLEPLLENNVAKPWTLTASIFQGKAYPIASNLSHVDQDIEVDVSVTSEQSKRSKRKAGFESETSADEADTDNEMTFIKNPFDNDSKNYNVDIKSGNTSFLKVIEMDDSDSEKDNGLMDKLTAAVGHLFTDDSSAEDFSNDEDSSAPEPSEVGSEHEEDIEETFVIIEPKPKKDEHRTVTLRDPVREDSVDSGLETESFSERICTYFVVNTKDMLNLTVTPAACDVISSLITACTNRDETVTAIVTAEAGLSLINDIGPGSTVQLKTRAETDLAGNDSVIAIADYYVDTSRPSTPGCDTSSADILHEESKQTKLDDATDEWDCFEGGFPSSSVSGGGSENGCGCRCACACGVVVSLSTQSLQRRITDETLVIKLQDVEQLTIYCPQRTVSKLHALPSKHGARYYLVVERSSKNNKIKIVVRSPLQIRNETSYALQLFYKKTELQAVNAELIGSETNPFADKMRLTVLAPHDTYNVPLYVAYHCKLYLLPLNTESYQSTTQGIWWMDLAKDLGTPRDIICPPNNDGDEKIFAMRILTVEGIQSHKVTRSIPNYVVRVLPPLAIYNRLPYGVQVSCPGVDWTVRIEAGERAVTYTLPLSKSHRLTLLVHYMGLPWTGGFSLTSDMAEKQVNMRTECETDGGNNQLGICVKVERSESWQLYLHAPYWIINKTTLPLQMKSSKSECCYEVTEEPLLWPGGSSLRGGPRVRFRAHHSSWSHATRLPAAAPGLLVCSHHERRTSYRILLTVTLSELCPQLTKIVTLLPYFLVYNDTKRHLRFMEENEAADLWIDLAPQQCIPFWPQTDSMAMHCKYRDSSLISHHFAINKNHFTVLRMDKGSAICVNVTGGTDCPFTTTFKTYCAGDAPVRVDNLCDDLFLKLHQVDSGQVALLSPYQSLLYTWDDPMKERKLLWNIYNNKGEGVVADFKQDNCGEEKVFFHSIKHSTLVATSSVTSKLTSTLKRLTPRSPENLSSSSDDSDSSDLPETHKKTKKMRKDKVVVYWISFMDGYQRVFALTQDERIAYQYRMRISPERSNFEVYMSLPGAGLSVCVLSNTSIKELAYISLTDSIPRWEVNISHKWKQLSPDVCAWIEEKYQSEQKKCELKEYLHIDLEKMQMTKPFFSELRRIYNPGISLNLRKSHTHTFCRATFNRLQIDNQLNEAIFPSVLYPAPVPLYVKNKASKPCIELVFLKHYRPEVNQDIYKHIKLLVREHCINLDRGFVNYVFDILNRWTVEEKPAVRLRADLALVHMPLTITAIKSQGNFQRNVLMERVHLSPIKLIVSLSSRGYLADNLSSPSRSKLGKENRPRLFKSDLLEYLFSSWGDSLCDMKDIVFRMSSLEMNNVPLTISSLMDVASRHYWIQLVQQFYVLVMELKILGNPYSTVGDFTRDMKNYYEPYMGTTSNFRTEEVTQRISQLLMENILAVKSNDRVKCAKRRPGDENMMKVDDIPQQVLEACRTHPASLALALTVLIARPSFDEDHTILRHLCREAAQAVVTQKLGGLSALHALQAIVERSGGRLQARRLLPRHCPKAEGVRIYSYESSLGAQLLRAVCRGQSPAAETYLAHAHLAPSHNHFILLSTRHVFLVRVAGNYSWHVEWSVRLDELIGTPVVREDKLVLNVKQDEMINYFSTDEKIIEIQDSEVLAWIQRKIECALIMALEDKRCAS